MQSYRAPVWLPGGNLQTIWAATRSRRHLGRAVVYMTNLSGAKFDEPKAPAAAASAASAP